LLQTYVQALGHVDTAFYSGLQAHSAGRCLSPKGADYLGCTWDFVGISLELAL